MTKQKRRKYAPEQRAAILRRHFVDKMPVSEVCEEAGIQPSLFYQWQKQAMEGLELALQDGRSRRGEDRRASKEAKRIAELEAKVAHKDEVIAEVSEMLVAEKKSARGES